MANLSELWVDLHIFDHDDEAMPTGDQGTDETLASALGPELLKPF